MTVFFHPEAEHDLVGGLDYYELQNPGLGHEFVLEVQNATDFLKLHPGVGQRIDAPFRRLLLRRFPYSIIYVTIDETIRVVSIAHQSRRPGFWRDRLERN